MQQSSFQAKFKAAIAIAQMDRNYRSKNKDQIQNQLHGNITQHNGNKCTLYMGNDEMTEIDKNEIKHNQVINKNNEQQKIPSFEVMLLKKSKNSEQEWKQRWTVCKNNRLIYYLPEDRNSPHGVLDFNIMSYSLQDVKDQQQNIIEFVLIPNGSKKKFIFKAETSQETTKCYQIVKENKDTSWGAKQVLDSLNKYPIFWRTDRISYQQFLQTGDTADILLFRSNETNALIQRGLTGSDYDHAAILLRYQSGSLYTLEATKCFGVGLCSWKIERDQKFLQIVSEFVNENMGTKFSFNLMKMLRKQSPTQDSNKSINKAERTLFNSELVAALYKELGIFDQQKSAAQYWPGCLSSENKKLLILKGKLQQEQLIDFSYI